MKTFHGGSQYFKMSLVSLIIIITLMLQAFAPGAAIGSAGTDQSNKTVNKGAGSDLLSNAASDVLIRPIIEQKAAVLGDRHSSSEPDIDIEQTESRPDTSFLFVENVGQFDPKEIFQMKQKSSYMRFSRDSIWITLLEPDDPFASSLNPSADGNDRIDKKQKGVNIQIDFVDSNKQPDIEGFDRSESKVSYFYGNDENNWRPDVPVWNGIRYIDLYPGIDLEISNNSGALAWQLVVRDSNRLLEWINKKSGNDIRFQVKGTQSISLNSQTLQFTSAIGELFLPQMQIVWADGDPLGIGTIAPQVGDNEYILISNDHFGKIAANNGPEAQEQTAETQAPAVPDGTGMVDGDIQTFDTTYVWDFTNDSDAMRLMETSGMVWGTVFSTILGTNAVASDIIVDSEGYSYVVGYTSGATFPTTPGAFQTSMNGNRDGFVSKINPFGSSLIYSTFFGGSSTDEVFSVALDDVGSAYITGWSISWDFPATYGAFQTGNYGYDAFVTKLNSTGTWLIYSTLFGRALGDEEGKDIIVDGSGHAFIVGYTAKGGIPTTVGAYDTSYNGAGDGFIIELSADASTLLLSTYLGGSGQDCLAGITDIDCSIILDPSGNINIAGYTDSSDFPRVGGFGNPYGGNKDAFVAKLNPSGSSLIFSGYLGGSGIEGAHLGRIDIKSDSLGDIYVIGTTGSSDFPGGTYHGGQDIFLAKFGSSGGEIYANLFGGSGDDYGNNVYVSPDGTAFITGRTSSLDYPVTLDAIQFSLNGQNDTYFTRVGADGSSIGYSTFFGGGGQEIGYGIFQGPDTSVYLAGWTGSTDFPTTPEVLQPFSQGNDAFVVRFALETYISNKSTYSTCGGNKIIGINPDDRECSIPQSTQGLAGDPINTRTGGFDVSFTDISISTVAGPLTLQRYYSSGTVNSYTLPLGYGWTHNQDTRLIFPADPGGNPEGILFKAHSLNTYLFYDNGDGTFSPEVGLTSSLVQQAGTPVTYTITDQSQRVYTFDDYGKLTLWEDGKGHSWSYSYDVNNRLYRITDDASSDYLEIVYTTAGYVDSVSDSLGRSVSYGYDAAYDLVSVTDIQDQLWTLTYDTTHHFRLLTDPGSKVIIHTEYDVQGRAYQQYDGQGNLVMSITFNADGTRIITDGQGNDITHAYDNRNTLISSSNSLDETKSTVYNSNFRPETVTDENQNELSMVWSTNAANLESMTDAEGNQTDLFYDTLNNLESVTLPSDVSYQYGYSDTLMTSSTNPLLNTTNYTYTDASDAPAPVGLLKTREDPLGHITWYWYNAAGQLIKVTDALDQDTQYVYDEWGNIKAVIYPSGRQDWSCYNATGHLTLSVGNASGGEGNWSVEPCSESYVPLDDPAVDRMTKYHYDLSGNSIAVEDIASGIISRSYFDENQRLVTSVNNLYGQTISNPTPPVYDPYYPDRNIRTDYVYDINGNMIGSIDTLGIKSRTYYDSENRPEYVVSNLTGQDISVITPPTYNPAYPDQNVTTQMVYDPTGNQIATISPLGIITRTYYDRTNRPVSVVQNLVGQSYEVETLPVYNSDYPDQNIRTDTVYDANGNVIAGIDTLGRITRSYYTALDQLATTVQNLTGQSIETTTPPTYNPAYPGQNVRTDYYYDTAGNQIAIVDPKGIITRTYYDELNRQRYVVRNLQGPGIEVTTPPTYNPAYPDQNVLTETVYDNTGQTIANIAPNGIISRTYFDGLGRTVTMIQNLTGQIPENPVPPTFNPAYPDQNVRSDVVFDSPGDEIAQIANDGRITRTYYDGAHRRIEIVDNLTNWSITDPTPPGFNPDYPDQNVRTLTSYDGLGRVIQTINPTDKVTYSCYDGLGRVVRSIDNPSVSDPCINYSPAPYTDYDIITRNTYDGAGNLLVSEDTLGNHTWHEYDTVGRMKAVIDPLSHRTEYAFDGLGNQVYITDAKSVVTKFEYDSLNRLTAVVENYLSGVPADNQTNVRTEYTYDANGNLLTSKNARNQSTIFTYDSLNRQKTETDPLSHTTTSSYDAAGNMISKLDADGFTTSYSYDDLSRMYGLDYPGSDPDVSYTYNAAGSYDTMTDGLGTTHWVYDGLGRTSNITDPNNQSVGYLYDASGNRKKLTYPDLKQVSYDYDLAGRMTTATAWDTTITRYYYDRKGQPDWTLLPNNAAIDYAFSGDGYLAQKVNALTSGTISTFDYIYDEVGNRTQATETMVLAVTNPGSDALFSDSYESADLSKWNRSKTDQGDLSITSQAAMSGAYGLNALIDDNNSLYVVDWSPKNETRYKASFKFDPNSTTISTNEVHYLFYGYNVAGAGMLRVEIKYKKTYQIRLETLNDSAWNSTSWFSITDAPNTIQLEWKAASSTTVHDGTLQLWVDGVSKQLIASVDNDTVRLDTIKLGTVEGVDSGTRGTEYFDDFNSWRSQAWVAGETVTRTIDYTYDPLYRLTSADSSDGDLFQYTYDATGNRLTETTPGNVSLSYAYDEANRLSNVDGTTYTWDNNGNLMSDGLSTYTYNHSDRLTGVSQSGHTYSYAYNGLGDRMSQTVDATTVDYALDLAGGLSQVLTDGTNTYLYGSQRIAQYNSGGMDYYIGDALNNVRQMFNPSNVLTLSRDYEPYGTVYNPMGSRSTSYGFTGEWTDGTGLVNLRARYYQLVSGRFTTMDTWGVSQKEPISQNLWLYANSDPFTYMDPTGHYGVKTHYWLTYYGVLGIASQMSSVTSIVNAKKLATVIAAWDLQVDSKSSVLNSFACLGCHFKSLSGTFNSVNYALSTGDPTLFGGTMHLIQDYFSHWYEGYHDQIYGHAIHTMRTVVRNDLLLSEFFQGEHWDQHGYWMKSPFPAHPRGKLIEEIRSRNKQIDLNELSDDWDLVDLYLRYEGTGFVTLDQRMRERDYFGFDTDKSISTSDREYKMRAMTDIAIGLFLGGINRPHCGFGVLDLTLPPESNKENYIRGVLLYGST